MEFATLDACLAVAEAPQMLGLISTEETASQQIKSRLSAVRQHLKSPPSPHTHTPPPRSPPTPLLGRQWRRGKSDKTGKKGGKDKRDRWGEGG